MAGYVTRYAGDFDFLTVRGSGHMVPQFRPRAALTMITHVLRNESLAPPLPSDAAIAAMSDADFDAALDAWTALAQTAAFLG